MLRDKYANCIQSQYPKPNKKYKTHTKPMKTQFTAIIKQDGDWWLGWVEEVPGANAQERTKEELLISLKEAALDIIELRRMEARRQAVNNYEEVPLVI